MMPLRESTKMFDEKDFNFFLEEIAGIESSGEESPYTAIGGSGDHYDGKYQMGKDAKIEAGKILGIELLHTPEARKAFREDPMLQERAMEAFTQANHKALINKQGQNYTSLSPQEQLAHLAYAHNQGAGGASMWMKSGYETVGKDGFGTEGSRYASAVRGALGIASPSDHATNIYYDGKDKLRDVRDVVKSQYKELFGEVNNSSEPTFDEIGPQRFAYHIARDNNMTLEELQSLNPEQEITYGSQGTRMQDGLKLRTGGYENLA